MSPYGSIIDYWSRRYRQWLVLVICPLSLLIIGLVYGNETIAWICVAILAAIAFGAISPSTWRTSMADDPIGIDSASSAATLSRNFSPVESLLSAAMASAENSRKWASINYISYLTLWSLAIACSFAASVVTFQDHSPGSLLAIVAAIPGLVIVLTDKFQFQKKTDWHWEKYYRLSGLVRRYEFHSLDPADLSVEIQELHLEMEKKWPGYTSHAHA